MCVEHQINTFNNFVKNKIVCFHYSLFICNFYLFELNTHYVEHFFFMYTNESSNFNHSCFKWSGVLIREYKKQEILYTSLDRSCTHKMLQKYVNPHYTNTFLIYFRIEVRLARHDPYSLSTTTFVVCAILSILLCVSVFKKSLCMDIMHVICVCVIQLKNIVLYCAKQVCT